MNRIGSILFLITVGLIFAASPLMAAGNADKGKQVYMANCAACHGMNPAVDGPIGPASKGASKALITARILNGSTNYAKSYPAGYTPKRATRIMIALPHLKGSIDDLVAYLK